MADGEELKKNLSESSKLLNEIRAEAAGLDRALESMSASFKSALKGGTDEAKATERFVQKSLNSLKSSAAQLSKVSQETLKGDTKSVNLSKEIAKAKANQLVLQAKIKTLTDQLVNATEEEAKALMKSLEVLVESEIVAGVLVKKFNSIGEAAEEIDSKGKYFDKAEKFVNSIPGLSGLLGPGFREASKGLKEASLEKDKFQKGLLKTSAIAKGIGTIVDISIVGMLTKADSATTNLAKQLAISKDSARDLRAGFNSIAIDSGTAALNSQNLTEAFIQLGDEVGAVSGFNAEQIEQQGRLTNLVGLQAGEAAKLSEFGVLNGETTRSQTTDILEQVKILEQETGIRLDGRKILAEVANISGQLGAQYGYNVRQLSKAVIQAQRLGLTLEDTKNIAGNLLDFESSITSELEAELLLGKNLNLEQARLLALQGDSAGAAAELAKQFGNAEEFSQLNVIQQESLAKAMGMSTDQLADSIKKQQVLSSLGVESIKQLEKQGRLEELKGDANGELLLQQYEQQSAADALTNAVNKIQSAFGSLLEGPLGGVLDTFVGMANSATAIYTAMGLLAGLSLVRLVGGIASMAASLVTAGVASASTASALTLGLGSIAIIAATSAIVASMMNAKKQAKNMKTEDDAIIPPGYGDRIISSPKGSIALNNQDTLVAGTNLGGGKSDNRKMEALLEKLVTQNDKKPQLSPVGLYEVQ